MPDQDEQSPMTSHVPVLDPVISARLKRDSAGLVAAVVQQHDTGEVLMLAWMDDEALRRTLTEGRVTYFSRSRGEYWRKGDTSGHAQYVKSVAIDCDGDALLIRVDQVGAACHTGATTCFEAGGDLGAAVGHQEKYSLPDAAACVPGHAAAGEPATDARPAKDTAEVTAPGLMWGETWPNADEFTELAENRRVIPVVRRLLVDDITPIGLYRTLAADRPGTFLCESAESDGKWARYSFIGVASRATLSAINGQAHWAGDVPAGIPTSGDVLHVLDAALTALRTPPIPGLPPFTGGFAGAIGWDAVRHWEPTLPATTPDELGVPELALCLASDLAVVDHEDGSVWLIANAINFDNTRARVREAYDDAVRRVDAMAEGLATRRAAGMVTVDEGSGGRPGGGPELEFRSTRAEFEAAVLTGKAAIREGEVFQVVLSQRIDVDCPAPALDVYRALRTVNPSPYMYYFQLTAPDGGPFAVVGSSPETLVKVEAGRVTTYPIAGSRPRGVTEQEDLALGEDLLADPKERAEHIMLVDLSRNDLAKVCEPASVDVVEFMVTRRFSHIMHLCSTVVGRLRAGRSALDTFRATFPAGTLSGAPKPRAIALIDALEPASRGIYGGTVGYFDFGGNMDMAIAIRTALLRDGRASIQAGAGIVADSVPALEYEESRNKAQAVVRAIELATRWRTLP